jgi:protein SCO1
MRRLIPLALWLVVLVTFGILSYIRYQQWDGLQSSRLQPDDPPGRVLMDLPWRHFQDVPPIEMTDQFGRLFDSREFAGKPLLINFFFARCPVICREMNSQIAAINDQLKNLDLLFLSVTVDPINDQPEVLNRYSQDFGAKADRWFFLTDQPYKIVQLGEHVFETPIGSNPNDHSHTEDLLLVDKWGRFRDRFRWDDPHDVRRLLKVVAQVSAETEPPLEQTFRTRNVIAGRPPFDLKQLKWVREFRLIDQDNQPFYSRDLTGEVWIASFFYTRCKGACNAQRQYLKTLRAQYGDSFPTIVSLTADPEFDIPEVLKGYADDDADERWRFCTGERLLIQRIGEEFFGVPVSPDHHSPKLLVVDRWHQVRGGFDWSEPEQQRSMLELIERLKKEDRPVYEALHTRRPPTSDEGVGEGQED